MKQEEKELLLKDLCARSPYGVKVQCESDCGIHVVYDMTLDVEILGALIERGENIKPYLRPMSSMTEEEWREYKDVIYYCKHSYEEIDWLNAHHIDYRGLIEKGLAIEAPKDMYTHNIFKI